ncbi:hypothetical protein E0Z10_g7722 [Xylaria hypoxylon]|uniref:Uncharacterized protein n=1 Tax=Xylaria hypoxylon TaxID=37992 RepID=A0A4Z0YA13_9PEZI|nr:hypothetical protein E0Z10_g7722 [Xylaria hypoxylon]
MNLLRSQTYPYASSSTGPYRGLLVRKYPCWDARGPVRETFTNEIAGKIKNCLEQCLPESNSFVGFSLFMVGKLPEKTKPTIMIVSDDKTRRKAAFQIVKAKHILKIYPGFELGHCSVAAEFEDLRQLGPDTESAASILESTEEHEDLQYIYDGDGPGEELLDLLSAEVCAFEYPVLGKATRLYFHTSPNSHSHNLASATCGGLFRFQGEDYALTMAHAIRPTRRADVSPKQWEPDSDSSSESDDFEITGMDDWEEDDGDTKTLTAITSPGSRTPSELSDSEGSLLKRHDSQRSSEISIRTHVAVTPSIVYEDDYMMDAIEDDDELPDTCERFGSVVSVDSGLDIAVIKVTGRSEAACSTELEYMLNTCANRGLSDTRVTVRTTHHPEIKGQRSGTPFYTRFPGTSNFLELHSVHLDTPVRPGDSGSWAFDGEENVVGFVSAGNPKSGLCLLLPTKLALESMHSLLLNRAALARTRMWAGLGVPEFPLNMFGDIPDEDEMTVASSLPPPSIFSQRMDHGTPSTSGYSTTATWYERKPNTPQPQESLARGNAESTSSFVSRSDFLQDQAARLRRELERAWEIIQEKDKRLQQFIAGDLDLEILTKDMSLQMVGSQFGSSQDSVQVQVQGQLSPSEPSYSQTTLLSEYSRTASPEAPGVSVPSPLRRLKALKTELAASNRFIEETRTMWRTEVDLNEALTQENQQLKKGIQRAIEAIHKAQGGRADREGLLKIASNLGHVLFHNGGNDWEPIPSSVKVKELEQYDPSLMDIPPFPKQTPELRESQETQKTWEPQSSNKTPSLQQGPQVVYLPPRRLGRRILTPKSRLTAPLLASGDRNSSLSETGRIIDTVPEEDEDDGNGR